MGGSRLPAFACIRICIASGHQCINAWQFRELARVLSVTARAGVLRWPRHWAADWLPSRFHSGLAPQLGAWTTR